MKRRQKVCRPLGGMSPLSDRAPINIQIGEGRAVIFPAKTISNYSGNLASPVSKNMACYQSNRWNLGDPNKSVDRRTVKC